MPRPSPTSTGTSLLDVFRRTLSLADALVRWPDPDVAEDSLLFAGSHISDVQTRVAPYSLLVLIFQSFCSRVTSENKSKT